MRISSPLTGWLQAARAVSFVALFAAGSTAAMAADLDAPSESPTPGLDLYVSVFGGATFPSDTSFSGVQVAGQPVGTVGFTGAGETASISLDGDESFTVGGAIGHKLPQFKVGFFSPRIEAEVNYREFDGGGLVFSGTGAPGVTTPTLSAFGEQSALNVYGNIVWDIEGLFDPLFGSAFTPYAGVGLGVSFFDSDISYEPAAGVVQELNSSDEAFTYQVIFGFKYKLFENVEVFAEGRYFDILDVDTTRTLDTTGPAPVFNSSLEGDLDGFTAQGGITYSFENVSSFFTGR